MDEQALGQIERAVVALRIRAEIDDLGRGTFTLVADLDPLAALRGRPTLVLLELETVERDDVLGGVVCPAACAETGAVVCAMSVLERALAEHRRDIRRLLDCGEVALGET